MTMYGEGSCMWPQHPTYPTLEQSWGLMLSRASAAESVCFNKNLIYLYPLFFITCCLDSEKERVEKMRTVSCGWGWCKWDSDLICLDWDYYFLIEFSNQCSDDCVCVHPVFHKTVRINQQRISVIGDWLFCAIWTPQVNKDKNNNNN